MIVYIDIDTGNTHECSSVSSVPSGAIWTAVTDIPDNTYRDAWKITNSQLDYDLPKAKAIVVKKAAQKYDEELSVITSLYSASERETWGIQEAEASNFQHDVDNLVNPKRPTPNLDWIITQKDGLPVDDIKRQALVTRILTKAYLFHQLSSTAVGKRHKMSDAIEAATTKEQLDAIVYG